MEVKYHSGKVYCTNDRDWKQVNSKGVSNYHKNASNQVLRTRALLKKMLKNNSISNWPIKSVVVYTHPNAVIYKAKEPKAPQTEVLTLSMFKNWIDHQSTRKSIVFSGSDFEKIKNCIKSNEKAFEYEDAVFD